ncbi:MAG: nicotinate (nicotinamide) nucleotide adenylyltransferase [candidate division WOR-3 bacterium]
MKGIFGGNFDPVHIGHLILATDALDLLNLEKILFVPAWRSPFKNSEDSLPFKDRYNMLKLATKSSKFFEVLDIESKRKGISYTYDTIKELLKKEKELCLLIGEDQACDFKKWYKWEEILKLVKVFVFRRSVVIPKKFPKGLILLNSRIVQISSTEIRDKIKEGKPVDFLLPKEVLTYINRRNLYK